MNSPQVGLDAGCHALSKEAIAAGIKEGCLEEPRRPISLLPLRVRRWDRAAPMLVLWAVSVDLAAGLLGLTCLWEGGTEKTAYIDPGIGLMLVQALVAAFIGFIFYLKSLRQALGRFFARILGKNPSAAEKISRE